MALVNEKAALIVKDKDAVINLVPEAIKLIYNENFQRTLSINIKKFARPFAAESIVKEVIKIAN
jgi:UDP-N-acetylglucosamine--N-acetylmuramyl-(pentapeptide) pyrophosphoryl-undecaprenol N-acetylglucosamine transferase